jgi:hypothetical protein
MSLALLLIGAAALAVRVFARAVESVVKGLVGTIVEAALDLV